MDKSVLAFIEKLELFKTKIKALHWDANSLSQHELCDDIAESIAEFQDQVSEVEQSISGKLPKEMFKPSNQEYGEVGTLKEFVENVIEQTNAFYKKLASKGDKYIGMRSDCESFLSDMQRKLYLVNFTLKEELKKRIRDRIMESRPKNLSNVDDVDKFIGRRPKTMKARINQIYRLVKKYGIDSRVYSDEHWQAIDDYYKAISSLGCDVSLKPCGHIENADSLESDGGYCDYDDSDNMPRSKQYAIKIEFDDGMTIGGYIKCMACGTVSDPFSRYDTCMVLFPKSNKVLESREMNRKVKLTESELKDLVKRSIMNVLTETRLDYDVDNFSGKHYKDFPSDDDYVDGEGYFDDPNRKGDIEYDLADYASEEGKPLKDVENDYSWDKFDRKPIAQGVDDYYKAGKGAVSNEIDKAIARRARSTDWSDRELGQGRRMMGKYVNGQRDADDIDEAWDDLHFESKKAMKVTESELKDIVKEAAMNIINGMKESIEIDPSKKGTFTAAATKHGKSVQDFASEVLNNKDKYSSKMVKKANFAKNFGGK